MGHLQFIMIDEEVAKEAYAFLFSYCDKIEYLSESTFGYLGDTEKLAGTELACLIPAQVGACEGESWNMHGTLYTFSLTKDVQELVKKYGLQSALQVHNGYYVLQNATLYKGDVKVFSVCTHEGEEFFESELKAQLDEACRRAIERSSGFVQAQAAYEKVKKRKDRKAEEEILRAVESYVAHDCGSIMYQAPAVPCSYRKFLKLAKKYLSPQTYKILRGSKRFADLHPQGYPKTFEEISHYALVPTFGEGELNRTIQRELFYLSRVEEREAKK